MKTSNSTQQLPSVTWPCMVCLCVCNASFSLPFSPSLIPHLPCCPSLLSFPLHLPFSPPPTSFAFPFSLLLSFLPPSPSLLSHSPPPSPPSPPSPLCRALQKGYSYVSWRSCSGQPHQPHEIRQGKGILVALNNKYNTVLCKHKRQKKVLKVKFVFRPRGDSLPGYPVAALVGVR